jgi:hypothetical protein
MLATILTATACALTGHGEMLLPSCTPGEARLLTRQERCTSKPRAHIPAAVRRTILARYGLTETTFEGKLDHRFPHWAGGSDTAANLWPYVGVQPFPKDRLESYARHRYCITRNLRITTIRRWFLGDWRPRWRYYEKRDWPLAASSQRRARRGTA